MSSWAARGVRSEQLGGKGCVEWGAWWRGVESAGSAMCRRVRGGHGLLLWARRLWLHGRGIVAGSVDLAVGLRRCCSCSFRASQGTFNGLTLWEQIDPTGNWDPTQKVRGGGKRGLVGVRVEEGVLVAGVQTRVTSPIPLTEIVPLPPLLSAHKYLTLVPTVLLLVALVANNYSQHALAVNVPVWVVVVSGKMPSMYRVRLFGINSTPGAFEAGAGE